MISDNELTFLDFRMCLNTWNKNNFEPEFFALASLTFAHDLRDILGEISGTKISINDNFSFLILILSDWA